MTAISTFLRNTNSSFERFDDALIPEVSTDHQHVHGLTSEILCPFSSVPF